MPYNLQNDLLDISTNFAISKGSCCTKQNNKQVANMHRSKEIVVTYNCKMICDNHFFPLEEYNLLGSNFVKKRMNERRKLYLLF